MPENSIIKKTSKPITEKMIITDLKLLGIEETDILLVHSSLSSIGWVCGGAQTVINALLKTVSRGTIVMPAHSGDLSDPEEWSHPPVPREWIKTIYETMPAFDVDLTTTRSMGKTAELFRTLPKTERSLHPQGSFSAQGDQASLIIKNHPLTPQFGMMSPLGNLYQLPSKVLLLGVGYENATCFHLAETMIRGMNVKKYGAPIIVDGERKWQWFKDFDYDSDDFDELGKAFEKTHEVAKGKVGNAISCVFDLKKGVDFAKSWIEKNR